MIYNILIFFLFLSPLIFFHELGHFFFARLFGVRVETFSIGFGPKLFSWKRGDTVYAFSAIPLGGYVKMFGDDPLSEKELTPEEAKVAYTSKSKWARFWIVFGGPLANFILAFVLYLGLATGGEKVPEPKLGVVKAGTLFEEIGFQTGDVLKKLNSNKIFNFDDVAIADSTISSIEVERDGTSVLLKTNVEVEPFQKGLVESIGYLKAPVFVNPKGESFVLKPTGGGYQSLEELVFGKYEDLDLVKIDNESLDKLEVFDPSLFMPKVLSTQKLSVREGESLQDKLTAMNLYPRELMIQNVTRNSAAFKAKLKKGQLIVSVGGEELFSFTSFKEKIQSLKEEKPIEIQVLDEQGLRSVNVTPTFSEQGDQRVLLVGIQSGVIGYSKMIEFKAEGWLEALTLSVERTIKGTANVIGMFKKLIFGEVSVKNLGGPIAIGKAANDYFELGWSMFFRLMALISINLAVINLFPIPVLDGGHIVFILVEILNRGPLSRKKLLYAQQFGMSLLFLLIFVAIFNDIKRFFL